MAVPTPLVLVLAGVFGAMMGSFLNVVIHRLPDRKSLVSPGSHCPACGKPVRWFDNLPVLSWFLLGGKCRDCKAPISPRYLLVEALTAGLTIAVALRYRGIGGDWRLAQCLASLLLVYPLVPVTFIDLKLKIIPDRITKPGMVVAVLASLVVPDLHEPSLFPILAFRNPHVASLLVSLLGVLAGAGVIWLMGVAGKALFKKESMGFGDVKFMAMVGGFIGPVGVLLAILIACLVGSVVGILLWLITRSHYLAFGPFLALGALLTLFFRPDIIHFVTVTYPNLFR
jgi:leader peptidase (prepilin peptidase)/N-methyltransferase